MKLSVMIFKQMGFTIQMLLHNLIFQRKRMWIIRQTYMQKRKRLNYQK